MTVDRWVVQDALIESADGSGFRVVLSREELRIPVGCGAADVAALFGDEWEEYDYDFTETADGIDIFGWPDDGGVDSPVCWRVLVRP